MLEVVQYVLRVYVDGYLHSTYRVDSEAEAWDLQTKLRYKLGNKCTDITVTEVLRYGEN